MSVDKSYVMAQLRELSMTRDEGDFSLTSSSKGQIVKAHSLILSMRSLCREIGNCYSSKMCISQV